MLGWLGGTLAAYLLTSFLSNFYLGTTRFVFLGLSLTILCAVVGYGFADEALRRLEAGWRREWPGLLVLLLASGLTAGALFVSTRFPSLFETRLLFMDNARLPFFFGLAVLSFPAAYVLVHRAHGRVLPDAITAFVHANLPGLLLAGSFFITYFTFAATINFPGHRTLDEYFDMDVSAWLARLTAPSARAVTDVIRAVHPAVMLFLRPPVWFISLFLHGDQLRAIFLMQALVAAACVFLTWRIVKRASGRTTYALLMATLLGASASHLLLGSMLETYIYSSLALLIFVSLLQSDRTGLTATVPAGVLIFGITVTNLAQATILYFVKTLKVKVIVVFMILVVGVVLILNVVQIRIYPAATSLIPSSLEREKSYEFDMSASSWKTIGRISLVAHAVPLYCIVAPRPYVLTTELGTPYPNFRTFKITIGEFHIAGYSGLGNVTAKLWLLILAAAALLFIWDFVHHPEPGLALGLVFCLGFNLALHIIYGDDPMLYSPDWVYALVLFVAFAFVRFADKKWFQLASIVFLAALIIVNIGLIRQIIAVSAPFYGR